MKGLLEMLAKSDKTPSSSDSDPSPDMDATDPNDTDDTGFQESATQAMDALKSGDSEAFADALKACIQMGQ